MAMILCKVGGGGGKPLKGNATVADVLDGVTFSNKNSNNLTGAMPNNGAVNKTLSAGSSYTVPAGYHDGSGIVVAKSLSSQTVGDATAASIRSGYKAWVNGTQITGTIADQGGGTYNPNKGSVRTLASAGKYLTSDIKVNGFSLPAAANLKKGVTFTLYGQSVTGTFEGYTSSPLYIIQNGVVKNLSTNGFTNAIYNSNGYLQSGIGIWCRSNATFNLSSYNYLKLRGYANLANGNTLLSNRAKWYFGISTGTSTPSVTAEVETSNVGILNVSNYSGSYYLFYMAVDKNDENNPVRLTARLYDLFVSTT